LIKFNEKNHKCFTIMTFSIGVRAISNNLLALGIINNIDGN